MAEILKLQIILNNYFIKNKLKENITTEKDKLLGHSTRLGRWQ